MKKTLFALCLLLATKTTFAEERFGRPIIKVKDAKQYQFEKLDDVNTQVLQVINIKSVA